MVAFTTTRLDEDATTVAPFRAWVVSTHVPAPRRALQVNVRTSPLAVMGQLVTTRALARARRLSPVAALPLRATCTTLVAPDGTMPTVTTRPGTRDARRVTARRDTPGACVADCGDSVADALEPEPGDGDGDGESGSDGDPPPPATVKDELAADEALVPMALVADAAHVYVAPGVRSLTVTVVAAAVPVRVVPPVLDVHVAVYWMTDDPPL